jgi:HD-GYP domain-containing protein (c-di-GMP phosphodiesterase class II)
MVQRRITMLDIELGKPLPWDLFNVGGQLLLGKGDVISGAVQAAALVENGVFADAAKTDNTESVLHQINALNKRLERLLFGLRERTDAQSDLLDIAKSLIATVRINPDVALACIFLSQISGGYTVRHCMETAILSILAATAMQKQQAEIVTVTAAALTMNVGMLRYTEQLQSQYTSLSGEELGAIRRHPEEGVNILRHAGIDDTQWLSYVLTHHENDDGSGYPEGRSGDQVPQNAKLISLADRYCAQVSARNYRKSIVADKALQSIFDNPSNAPDPVLAAAFVQELGNFPPGAFVRLNNGEIGVVSKRAGNRRPVVVHALVSATGVPLLPFPVARETDDPAFKIKEVLHEDQAGIRFSMRHIWGAQASL